MNVKSVGKLHITTHWFTVLADRRLYVKWLYEVIVEPKANRPRPEYWQRM